MRPRNSRRRKPKNSTPNRPDVWPPLESLFPTFLQKCAELHELLQIVAFMLFIVGTILFVVHGFSGKTLTFHMVRLFILTALLVFLPQWGNQDSITRSNFHSPAASGVDPSNVQDQYNNLLVVRRDTTSGTHSWWDILGDVSGFTVEVLISGIPLDRRRSLRRCWCSGPTSSKKFILFSSYALSPLLIGFMAIRPLRHTGARYLTHLVGFCFGRWAGPWPRSSRRAFSIS